MSSVGEVVPKMLASAGVRGVPPALELTDARDARNSGEADRDLLLGFAKRKP